MSELSREDFQQAFDKQAQAVEQHSRDQLGAINGLAKEIRGMASAIGERTPGPSQRNGNGIWPILLCVGALMFGLMTPMYIAVGHSNTALTEHKTMGAHPTAGAALAAVNEKLKEVETQFSNIDERTLRIELTGKERLAATDQNLQREMRIADDRIMEQFDWMHSHLDDTLDQNAEQQTTIASMWERIRALEKTHDRGSTTRSVAPAPLLPKHDSHWMGPGPRPRPPASRQKGQWE